MPFTAAHPAAALPLRRLCPTPLVWSALVVGTITPDLEPFLRLRPEAAYGLTFAGSFYFCLPAGLVLLAVYHACVKRPLTLLLPRGWRHVVWPVAARPLPLGPRWLVQAAASVLIGAWSHLIWDSFTHPRHWSVSVLPFLSIPLARFGGYRVTTFRLLQHASTLVGLACLVVAALGWKRRTPEEAAPRIDDRLRAALNTLLVALPSALAVRHGLEAAARLEGLAFVRQFVAYSVIAWFSFAALTLLAIGVAMTPFVSRLPRCDAAASMDGSARDR